MATLMQIPLASAEKELALNGVCSYHIEGETLYLDVAEVASRRSADSVSGGLVLEIWALESDYRGGDFSGYLIASQPLGSLDGQHCFRNCSASLPMQMPTEGIWTIVLMLRESMPEGLVTRDYINFAQQVLAECKMTLSLCS
ncbi:MULTISPECIES: hypothetical protein [unclassified Oceanobacter]|jgi:hypothetical protein|uniref:hypothetical protein n=1 Tax=unclassified Oceanobacter TaxID=2620260 RepID=UPI0026E4462F|nr:MULTISPECIES: hypothetical protein [unclassified Oceanobacter]MDO6682620.1 hypothetical protein [Oceanobacter sp. 5_MG-2023]MDP2506836.1 hypothetical protein [Oceanobacter sp. 3_MG-2023]MDP2547855.1 hypothetical protein [Oceanobacter sp. 4_MG-2023]MDP2608853.1 hypothetical protein [Oceanobacter sp. 1_MG-2023]MDP2611905.1 hypothetical protein [Oceanobacter sp. 2_MG-2023]